MSNSSPLHESVLTAVTIEPMARRHLRAVRRVDAQQSGDRWSAALFRAELDRGDARDYVVATLEGQVVGFAGMLYVLDEGHLTTIAVDEKHRGGGMGSALLATVVRRAVTRGCASLTLEVRASNVAALALYRRFGFAPAGVRKGYYTDDGEDALILWAHEVGSSAYAERLAAVDSSNTTSAPSPLKEPQR